nr:splicing factor 1 [Tanacetum cinerariifolium]
MEDAVQTGTSATASVSTTVSPKVSLFAKKTGFLIPKNKISGSMVPLFRGSKKPGSADVENKESTKQVPRKTKWGPDLTQDAFVRKGRALAYQTRLDQIAQRLKSGIMEDDSSATQESSVHKTNEKMELELERREIIGEILKLNPSYKAPPDYKPLLKEDKVAIPIKEHPGRNFLGLLFGPAGDTQKRLEKETGAKIRVYGTKADTKKEIEITSSEGNEGHGDYEELFVLVIAETYDKVDAAVSLIELLITPVLANAVAVTNDPVSGDNPSAVSLGQDTPVIVNTGSRVPSPLARYQPYLNPGFIAPPFPNSSVPMLNNPLQVSSTPSNSGPMPSSFGPGPQMMQPTVRPQSSQLVELQAGPPNAGPAPWFPSSNTSTSIPPQSIRPPPPPINALRPQQPTSNDFTFQTNRPQTPSSQYVSRPGNQPGSQYIPAQNPQSSSFRPGGLNNQAGPPVRPRFHGPQNNHQMGQQHQGPSNMPAPLDRQPAFTRHGPQTPAGHMGPRNFGPGPGSPAGPFPPRPSNFGPVQQNHPSMGFQPQNFSGSPNQQFLSNVPYAMGRPALNPSRPQQVYDPFSPTAVPHRPSVGNPQNSRKQDNDPEYDDLMASVGVK